MLLSSLSQTLHGTQWMMHAVTNRYSRLKSLAKVREEPNVIWCFIACFLVLLLFLFVCLFFWGEVDGGWKFIQVLHLRMSIFAAYITGCVHNGSLYISGGHTGVAHTNAVNCFRPKVGKWVMCAPLCTARSYHTMTAFRDQLYVIGGCCTTAGDVVNLQVCQLNISLRTRDTIDTVIAQNTNIIPKQHSEIYIYICVSFEAAAGYLVSIYRHFNSWLRTGHTVYHKSW